MSSNTEKLYQSSNPKKLCCNVETSSGRTQQFISDTEGLHALSTNKDKPKESFGNNFVSNEKMCGDAMCNAEID